MENIDYDAMVYPCRGLSAQCDNRGKSAPRAANLCESCESYTREAAGWAQRREGWAMPLHLACVDASLRALATMPSNTGLVCDFFSVLEEALLAQQSFNGFAGLSRYIHALAVSAPHVIGGILTDEDWASMRRCGDWCGHTPHVSCVKPCNAAMRAMVRMFSSGGLCALSVACGIVATIAANSRKRQETEAAIRDIMSLAPMSYAVWWEHRLRARYGVRPRISAWVSESIRATHERPAANIIAQQTAVEGRA